MEWSSQQSIALKKVIQWGKDPSSNQVYRLSGFAGTGKTTLAKEIADQVGGKVLFVAPTGKAAHVLGSKGCSPVSTIHKLIYTPKNKAEAGLKKLEADLEELYSLLKQQGVKDLSSHRRVLDLKKLITSEEENLNRPIFTLNLDSNIRGARLVICDEASMVGTQLGDDLLSFGVKVLALYDEGQLPPVKSKGFFLQEKADTQLTEIHRQAKDNPIIHLATAVRMGETISVGQYGSSSVVSGKIDPEIVMKCDQIIVGKNDTRFSYNKRLRQLLGFEGQLPQEKDKLVCLKNNHELGILNGAIYFVDEVGEEVEDLIPLNLQPEDEDSDLIELSAFTNNFTGGEPVPYWMKSDAEEFDYGYALTCHKSQGSQWPTIMVKDESWVFKQASKKWLYTAITRAEESVIILR